MDFLFRSAIFTLRRSPLFATIDGFRQNGTYKIDGFRQNSTFKIDGFRQNDANKFGGFRQNTYLCAVITEKNERQTADFQKKDVRSHASLESRS
jgi:hypothetical protein